MKPRAILTGVVTGALFVGSAWAGVGVAPLRVEHRSAADLLRDARLGRATVTGGARGVAAVGLDPEGGLGADEALVGAAKVGIAPQPDSSKGEVWEHDIAKCLPLDNAPSDPSAALTHAADWRRPWVENNNCIYAGGFGIGPTEPLVAFDTEYGLWSRSVAIRKGGQTLVLTILDGEGYFGAYNTMCGTERCGIFQIQDDLAAELGLDPAGLIFASTHAHSAPDFIGGWGGVPQWYMNQVAGAMRESVRQAVAAMQPAVIEAGDTLARGDNSERRDTYRSAEDPTINWLRAIGTDGATIATVGAYAAHATSFGGDWTTAHPDWPGVFDRRAEERFGGTGLVFEAGLGNMSARGNEHGNMGVALANLLPPVGQGTLVPAPRVRFAREFWDQPITNLPLGTLGAGGFFDRPFQPVPATLEVAGKDGSMKPCRTAAHMSAHISATAAKIGSVVVTAAPGEVFANFSNTIEELSPITALAIGQANDALGYMPQSFETDHAARQGPGFAGEGFFEYEDAYSIDACVGDKALEVQFRLLGSL